MTLFRKRSGCRFACSRCIGPCVSCNGGSGCLAVGNLPGYRGGTAGDIWVGYIRRADAARNRSTVDLKCRTLNGIAVHLESCPERTRSRISCGSGIASIFAKFAKRPLRGVGHCPVEQRILLGCHPRHPRRRNPFKCPLCACSLFNFSGNGVAGPIDGSIVFDFNRRAGYDDART